MKNVVSMIVATFLAPVIAVTLAFLVAFWIYSFDEGKGVRPMRVIQRVDGVYEVERRYGFFAWGKVGGDFETLEGAKAHCNWWREGDLKSLESKRRSAMKRKVIHECR